jgi:uncharacterized membrane protein (DUF106 family)
MIDISIIPAATLLIMSIAIVISFVNMVINRLLVTRLVGWEQYRTMQREISEYRSQTMQAMRSKDQKLLEKLKKKESQINSMQMKISKPQLYLIPISFTYIVIWIFFLTPLYGSHSVAYVPGIGGIPVFYWYFLCSLLFGTLASRVIGVTPLE